MTSPDSTPPPLGDTDVPSEDVELGEVVEWVDPNPPLSEQERDNLRAAGYKLPTVDGEWARPEWRKPPNGRARIDPELVHQVRRVMRERGDDVRDERHADVVDGLGGWRIDWPTFWKQERVDTDFLIEPILARGRGHAFVAP